MSKSIVRAGSLTCLLGLAGWVSDAQGASTLVIRAIAKNGALIAPTSSLAVAPGDTIVAEVAFSGWSTPPFDDDGLPPPETGLVQTFQAALLGQAGAISNGADPTDINRLVLPVGWVAPVAKDNCPCDNPAYPTCDQAYGCVGAGHTPSQMGNLSVQCTASNADLNGGTCIGGCCVSGFRSDYMFYGFSNQPAVDLSSLNIRWGGTIDGTDAQFSQRCSLGTNAGGFCTQAADCPGGGTCDVNFRSFAGTLNLKVGSQACGNYTFNFNNDINQTFIANAAANPTFKVPQTITPLVLTTGISCPDFKGPCCDETVVPPVCTNDVLPSACTGPGKRFGALNQTCATMNPPCSAAANQITGVDPLHCTIDARMPHLPGQPAQRRGFTSMTLTFQNPAGTGEDAPADFAVTQIPAAPAPPNPPPIQSVNVNGNQVTINFPSNNPIQPNRWTCVEHLASNGQRCLGFLPADTNANGAALPSDIIALIDSLNNLPGAALPITGCDLDRTGVCLPADIITLIDLLIGNGFLGGNPQNGDSLQACPGIVAP